MSILTNSDLNPPTPVEDYRRKRRYGYLFKLFFVFFIMGVYLFWNFLPETPDRYIDVEQHYKYGSIGSDNVERGLPFWVWYVLPEMFPEYLPDSNRKGYESFGFIREESSDRYVGFSKRRVSGIDLIGLNCAVCHASTWRESPNSPANLVLGMPSHTVDLQAMFLFFFQCVSDSRFNSDTVLNEIESHTWLGPIDRFIYKRAIEEFRRSVLAQKEKLAYWDEMPLAGPGRIDTFGPYKVLFFDLPVGSDHGTADFPSLWNQRMRQGMELHWDGNNSSVDERNISASIGAGVTPETLDEQALKRVADWILDLEPPAWPRQVDPQLTKQGKGLFAVHCYQCHGTKGDLVGKVVPINEIGTDPHRLNSFTDDLVSHMNTLGEGYPWRFKNFKKTNGYANSPLDGIWLRGPFLHNGSVPTLWHLLTPEERPATFYRGSDLYDWEKVGFEWRSSSLNGHRYFKFDTAEPGNGNGGHTYGSTLSMEEKLAIIEYLKTL